MLRNMMQSGAGCIPVSDRLCIRCGSSFSQFGKERLCFKCRAMPAAKKLPAPKPIGPKYWRQLLSPKENLIADGIGDGLSNRQIAAVAHSTEGTIKTQLAHIYAKLGISQRAARIPRVQLAMIVATEKQGERERAAVTDNRWLE